MIIMSKQFITLLLFVAVRCLPRLNESKSEWRVPSGVILLVHWSRTLARHRTQSSIARVPLTSVVNLRLDPATLAARLLLRGAATITHRRPFHQATSCHCLRFPTHDDPRVFEFLGVGHTGTNDRFQL